MNEPLVIHVNEQDEPIRFVPKLEAHQKGLLHRAVSVLVFTSAGEWIVHQRAFEKYHSGGLWTNTCCSHPYPNESSSDAAHRRLEEEMGFTCNLKEAFSFTYNTGFQNGLSEHEFDHVFFGVSDKTPIPNPEEVATWKTMKLEDIKKDIDQDPEKYTEWFKILLPLAEKALATYPIL